MSIEEHIKLFLKRLSQYYGVLNEDLELSFEYDIPETFLENIKNIIPSNEQLEYFYTIITDFLSDTNIDLNDDATSYQNIYKLEIKHLSRKKETKFRIRNFAITIDSGAIIPLSFFKTPHSFSFLNTEKDNIIRKIREIILFYGDSSLPQIEFEETINKIINPAKNSIIAIYNTTDKDFVKLYSKSYFIYLLKGHKTIYPTELLHTYRINNTLINTVNHSTSDFTQFFEIYDVIDEYHHIDDLLIKYLKLYQIIEYLITRHILVNIQSNTSNQNLFLREMYSLAKIDDFDEKNFKKVFENNRTDLSNWFKSKIDGNSKIKVAVEHLLYPNETKSFDTSNLNQVYNGLFRVLYKLRNTIVHNKESEIHLTIHNILLKEGIILLIKELIIKFEFIILKKVADFESTIKYKNKHLDLY
ncbi:hypothetical protein [Flavobacterium beibuense]|uniref:Uncharacterized protein n=1 Tax=Flavobacterium beibuense TaxID=657326 RepID=A0A444W8B8_9FLAO|nr:hypothetical protein [Flavobacterium beibuense]RYJ42155.1 hypothetical protein NU09_2559 [Flavobacterium beibuense]